MTGRPSPEASAELVRDARGVAAAATLVQAAGQGHTLLGRGDAAGNLAARLAVAVLVGGRAKPLVAQALRGGSPVLDL